MTTKRARTEQAAVEGEAHFQVRHADCRVVQALEASRAGGLVGCLRLHGGRDGGGGGGGVGTERERAAAAVCCVRRREGGAVEGGERAAGGCEGEWEGAEGH